MILDSIQRKAQRIAARRAALRALRPPKLIVDAAYHRRWRRQHRAHVRAQAHARYQRSRETILAAHAAWRGRNLEKRRANNRAIAARLQARRKHGSECQRRYRSKHHARICAQARAHYARRRSDLAWWTRKCAAQAKWRAAHLALARQRTRECMRRLRAAQRQLQEAA